MVWLGLIFINVRVDAVCDVGGYVCPHRLRIPLSGEGLEVLLHKPPIMIHAVMQLLELLMPYAGSEKEIPAKRLCGIVWVACWEVDNCIVVVFGHPK
eukprot:324954-Karenia_brevis.AAC.1